MPYLKLRKYSLTAQNSRVTFYLFTAELLDETNGQVRCLVATCITVFTAQPQNVVAQRALVSLHVHQTNRSRGQSHKGKLLLRLAFVRGPSLV